MAYRKRILLFQTTQHPQLVRELKNTQYIHQSRTRILRVPRGPNLGKRSLCWLLILLFSQPCAPATAEVILVIP